MPTFHSYQQYLLNIASFIYLNFVRVFSVALLVIEEFRRKNKIKKLIRVTIKTK